MKKININYNQYDEEELTQTINKKFNKRKSPVRKMRKFKEDKQSYEALDRRDL